MTESTEYGGHHWVPEIAHDTTGLAVADLTRAIAESDHPRDVERANNHVRNITKAGYLHPSGRTRDAHRHFRYRADQALAAGIFMRLYDAGVGTAEVNRAVDLALNAWNADDVADPSKPDVPRNPAAWVFREYLKGARDWSLEIVSARQDGVRYIAARLWSHQHGTGTAWHIPEGAEQRVVIAVDVDAVLAHISRPKG